MTVSVSKLFLTEMPRKSVQTVRDPGENPDPPEDIEYHKCKKFSQLTPEQRAAWDTDDATNLGPVNNMLFYEDDNVLWAFDADAYADGRSPFIFWDPTDRMWSTSSEGGY